MTLGKEEKQMKKEQLLHEDCNAPFPNHKSEQWTKSTVGYRHNSEQNVNFSSIFQAEIVEFEYSGGKIRAHILFLFPHPRSPLYL